MTCADRLKQNHSDNSAKKSLGWALWHPADFILPATLRSANKSLVDYSLLNDSLPNDSLLNYSPVYGNKAMKRARLMARVTACWLTAVQPVLRRLTIRP